MDAVAEKAKKQRRIISDRVDPAAPASIVLNKLGGLTRVCELTGWPTSTVHGWTVKGLIPSDRQDRLLELGRDLDDPVTPADFFRRAPADAVAGG